VWPIIGIFGVLVIATLLVAWLSRRFPQRNWQELQQRIRSWWVMVTVFSVALLLNRTVTLVFFALISFLALKEYLSIIPTRRADRRVLFWAYLAIPIQYWWIGQEWYAMFLIFIPVYMFLFLPMRAVMIGETKGFLAAIGMLQWGLMVTVFSISHIAYLLVLPAAGTLSLPTPADTTSLMQGWGPPLVLFLVMLTEANDIAQFIFGKLFGRRKVAPTVSPGKTLEGLLGGIVTTVGLSALLSRWLTPFSLAHALGAGVLISVGGFIGDLTISAVKRDLGRKDSGSLIPGHGGILDRIDSLAYTAPLFFHFMSYFYV
jgi:phosphatidate cytidylyltransferase